MSVSDKMILSSGNQSSIQFDSECKFTIADKKNIEENTKARHTHSNKETLDKITEEFINNVASKEDIGNIDTALDNIIAIDNQILGGGSV